MSIPHTGSRSIVMFPPCIDPPINQPAGGDCGADTDRLLAPPDPLAAGDRDLFFLALVAGPSGARLTFLRRLCLRGAPDGDLPRPRLLAARDGDPQHPVLELRLYPLLVVLG